MTFRVFRIHPRFSLFVSLLAVLVAGLALCSIERPASANSSRPPASSPDVAAIIVSLRDFGAVGDGITNDGPALQSALNALAAAGGGTLFVPSGTYAIATPVTKDFSGVASAITVQGEPSATVLDVAGNGTGLNLTSEFVIKVGQANDALTFKNLNSLLITDLVFTGVQSVVNDAHVVITLDTVGSANIEHCEFYGLASLTAGGAIVYANNSGLRIDQTAFLGCSTNSGVTGSMIENVFWHSFAMTNSKFVDYGIRPDFYSKTPLAAPYSWISIGNPATLTPASSRRTASIQNVFCDEGAYIGISSRPGYFTPSYAPFEVFISRVRMNVNNLRSAGIYTDGVRQVLVERSSFGWSHNASGAMAFFRSGEIILDQVECVDHADTIIGDSSTHITVINSIYQNLQTDPQLTRVIVTANPLDDPVQYVRQQFLDAFGRDPEPSDYFYWVGRLLSCTGECNAADIQRALATFLTAQPQPRFQITGRITDVTGAALSGVTIQLSGSQTATAITDAQGNYTFANLATSGQYTITPSKSNYIFQSQSFVEKTADQVANFTGVVGHVVSGRVTNGGSGTAGVEIRVTGSETVSATTDAAGHYWLGLPANGNYILTPFKPHYTFTPATAEFNNLTSPQVADFQIAARDTVEFSRASYEVSEGVPAVLVTVTRKGNTSAPAAIRYSMTDGTATQDRDYILATGVLQFAPNETTKTFSVLIIDNAWATGPVTATMSLTEPEGVVLGQLNQATLTILDNNTSPTVNPIENPSNFVNQQYGDFLARQPDAGGFSYWTDQITSCGTNQACIASRRVGVSAAFFVESEFQQTGGFVVRLFHSSLGRRPLYSEFMTARGYIISFADLQIAKQQLVEEFVGREEFRTHFPDSLTPDQFVNQVLAAALTNTGVDLSAHRETLLADLLANESRGRIVLQVAELDELRQAEFNYAFVLMQYFGYLRRDPDQGGFDFWLDVLDNRLPGNFRGMVCAFLTSREYQERFSPTVPRTDQECAAVQQ